MSLDPEIRSRLLLPAVCAPMFLVSGPDLVREACKAGIMAGLPRKNARSTEQYASWLAAIRRDLDAHADEHQGARTGPIAANLQTRLDPAELRASLDACGRYGVDIVITANGNPAEIVKIVHDRGGRVFHDVTAVRFAEKAIAAGVDGLTCIGAGGGGHSGRISHFALIPKIRTMFDGTVVMAGAITTGAGIRAAELLGADLAYLGTRFIATHESIAAPGHKELVVSQNSADLVYTDRIAGVAANWLTESIRRSGLDPDAIPAPHGTFRYDHLPEDVTPWRDIWSAGQGIDLIERTDHVADVVRQLRREYVQACETPDMSDVARLVDEATSTH
jgi:nitronate monooxygenase